MGIMSRLGLSYPKEEPRLEPCDLCGRLTKRYQAPQMFGGKWAADVICEQCRTENKEK
jgi:hypothetical protein